MPAVKPFPAPTAALRANKQGCLGQSQPGLAELVCQHVADARRRGAVREQCEQLLLKEERR